VQPRVTNEERTTPQDALVARTPPVRDVVAGAAATVTRSPLGDHDCELAFAGELDLHDAPEVERAFDEARSEGARRVLVDLTAVPFVDSTVLGILVASAGRFDALVLVVEDVRVLRVLQVTGLDRKLAIERSRPDALARLARATAA
jgi:anti-sigma B factor antagonist